MFILYFRHQIINEKDEKNFKHLFDIRISDIKIIEGKERDKRIELIIEYSDNLIIISPYCINSTTAIETANTIIEIFDRMMNGTLSYAKINQANITIIDANKKDLEMTVDRGEKRLLKVVGGAMLLSGAVAAGSLARAGKDIGK